MNRRLILKSSACSLAAVLVAKLGFSLGQAAKIAGTDTLAEKRALILKTILKILDECTDAEYDFAEINFRDKLIAAGVTFDAEE